jgi:hypothetical protein
MSDLLTVSETPESKEYWLQQGLGKGLEATLSAADALLVPEKDFREGVKFVFHQDTTTLFKYLSSHLLGDISIEILSNDDEYLEISLHSSSFRLGKIVVSYVAAPLLVGLLTNYLYDQMKAKPTDRVEASLVVEDHQCKSFQFSYQGEAKDFGLLADKVGELARKCTAASGKKIIDPKARK